jgi:hypothetical protein
MNMVLIIVLLVYARKSSIMPSPLASANHQRGIVKNAAKNLVKPPNASSRISLFSNPLLSRLPFLRG